MGIWMKCHFMGVLCIGVGREGGRNLVGEGFACVDIRCTHASCEPSCSLSPLAWGLRYLHLGRRDNP
jgi:hypothetical protein